MKRISLLVVIALMLSLVPYNTPTIQAGAPYPPRWVSPTSGSISSNPPTLVAENAGDPESEAVKIRFECNYHASPWFDVGGSGASVSWTDSTPWAAGDYECSARAMDATGAQSGASPGVTFRVPAPPQEASCSIDTLTATPPPPQVIGVNVTVYAAATCTNDVTALQFFVDGQHIGSVQSSSGSVNWNTNGWGANDHVIEARAVGRKAGAVGSRTQTYLLRPSGNSSVDNPSPNQPGGLPSFDGGDPPLAPGQQPGPGSNAPVCPSTPSISPGDIVVVSEFSAANYNVRTLPGTSKGILFTVEPYTYMTIIAGPLCADGYWWYEIGFEGKSGWMAMIGSGSNANLIQNGQPMPAPPTPQASSANQPQQPATGVNAPAQASLPIQVAVVANADNGTFRGWPFSPQAGSVQVVVDKLRIRDGPSTNHSVVGYVTNGDYYPILERSGDWGKIQTASGQVGWIYLPNYTTGVTDSTPPPVAQEVTVVCDGQVITVTDWNPDTQTTAQGTNCVAYVYPQDAGIYEGWTTPRYAVDYIQVTADNLNLRSGPGEGYSILGKVVSSHYYVLLETSGPWGKIRTVNLTEGWVYLDGNVVITMSPRENLATCQGSVSVRKVMNALDFDNPMTYIASGAPVGVLGEVYDKLNALLLAIGILNEVTSPVIVDIQFVFYYYDGEAYLEEIAYYGDRTERETILFGYSNYIQHIQNGNLPLNCQIHHRFPE